MKNIIKLGTFMLSLFIMTACNKNEDTKISSTEKEISLSQMENKANRLDQTGKLHNQFLDYFAANVDSKNNDLNIEDLISIYSKFARENQVNFDDEQRSNLSSAYNTMREMMGKESKLENISLDICKRFPAICDITGTGPYNPNPINILANTTGETSYDRTLKYIESIKDIENKVLASKEFNEKDMETILAFYSVARYSAAYWHNVQYVSQKSSYWFNENDAKAVRPCTNCNVVNADVTGAIVGALAGPWGSLGGAVVFSAAAKNMGWRWF